MTRKAWEQAVNLPQSRSIRLLGAKHQWVPIMVNRPALDAGICRFESYLTDQMMEHGVVDSTTDFDSVRLGLNPDAPANLMRH